MASKNKNLAELLDANGDVLLSNLDNVVIPSVGPTEVSDQPNTSTGGFSLPAGTTAQRPGTPDTGETRYNSDSGSIEFYDGVTWVATNLIPTIDSISGTIYDGLATDLTLSLTNATDSIDVLFKEGATTIATVNDVSVTSGSATVTVPAAVYGQTAGDTITIIVNNADGTPSSNSQTKTVSGVPSGGSISNSGSYRIHYFGTTDNFVVPSGLTLSNVEYIVVAGGGGGGGGYTSAAGDVGGGGGAGGYRSSVTGESSGRGSSPESKMTISAGTYQAVVGAGGLGAAVDGANGGNSSFNGITSIGGGSGGFSTWRYVNVYGGTGTNYGAYSGGAGGCGGGGASNGIAGTGTSGQGYDGGGNPSGGLSTAGAGGGAGSAGADQVNNSGGGSGVTSSISGSSYTYSSGGNAASANSGTNSGDGGGGSTADASNNGNGADGVVIIRYVLP
jgi:hypothetical protein